ncbi:MAG: signal peptide peptidase SppA [Actinobacteria bacterium]|nr:signal peptide peptidase SppA [Actinomycetota bacterium]
MNKIVLLPIKGMISSEEVSTLFQARMVSSAEIVRILNAVKKNKKVKALVLEISSPGGHPFPCKEIAEAIKKVGKPIVAWVREVAASGGYWVASAADVIVADALSTIGSVGVASLRPDVSELLKKIGIDVDVITSGIQKRFGFPFIAPTEEEKKTTEEEIRVIQQMFLNEIKKNRNLSDEVIGQISSGKTYFGEEAKKIGLVDELGGKEKAFEIAAKKAGLKSYKVLDYTQRFKKRGLLSRLFS